MRPYIVGLTSGWKPLRWGMLARLAATSRSRSSRHKQEGLDRSERLPSVVVARSRSGLTSGPKPLRWGNRKLRKLLASILDYEGE
jgi:hypothetical protein